MNLLDSASLVVTPNAYKTSKLYSIVPSDGSGDFAVTRTGDTATRVNANNIIDINRTNVILQSNVFSNASWSKLASSVTSGQTDPLGGTTAFKFVEDNTTANHILSQSVTTVASPYAFSVYAKAGERNWLVLYNTTATVARTFNLSTGVVGSGSVGTGSANIESIGGGWYRCTLVCTATAASNSWRMYLNTADSVNPSYAGDGTSGLYIWRSQLELGDFAHTYIDTTTAAVSSFGTLANVPRIDYADGGCPKLLIEPSRTNLFTYSGMIDQATLSAVTVTKNAITSLSGSQTADLVLESATTAAHQFQKSISATASTAYTISIFVKKYSRTYIGIQFENTNSVFTVAYVNFNLDSGTIATNASNLTANIVAYPNGWYRISATATAAATATGTISIKLRNADDNNSYLGVITQGAYFWGGQIEAGAFPTSYIHTFNASVTRNAESYLDSSVTSLIGQTEGTIYIDINKYQLASGTFPIMIQLDGGNDNNRIYIGEASGGNIKMYCINGSSVQVNENTVGTYNGRLKIAVGYKANDFILYVNGTALNTDTSASLPSLSRIYLGASSDAAQSTYKINVAALWKTKLSNADLSTLTSL